MKNEIKEITEIITRLQDCGRKRISRTEGVIVNNEDIATALYKAGYHKRSETVKEFAGKAEQRFREDSKWLDIMLKGYDCKDSEDYDAVANAIIIGRFANRLNDLAAEYGKAEK